MRKPRMRGVRFVGAGVGVGLGGGAVPGWILLEYTQWTCFSLHAIHRCTCVQLDF